MVPGWIKVDWVLGMTVYDDSMRGDDEFTSDRRSDLKNFDLLLF